MWYNNPYNFKLFSCPMKKNNKIKNKYYDFYSLFLNITNDFKWNRHISDNFLAISLKLLRHENQTSIKLSIIISCFLFVWKINRKKCLCVPDILFLFGWWGPETGGLRVVRIKLVGQTTCSVAHSDHTALYNYILPKISNISSRAFLFINFLFSL